MPAPDGTAFDGAGLVAVDEELSRVIRERISRIRIQIQDLRRCDSSADVSESLDDMELMLTAMEFAVARGELPASSEDLFRIYQEDLSRASSERGCPP